MDSTLSCLLDIVGAAGAEGATIEGDSRSEHVSAAAMEWKPELSIERRVVVTRKDALGICRSEQVQETFRCF